MSTSTVLTLENLTRAPRLSPMRRLLKTTICYIVPVRNRRERSSGSVCPRTNLRRFGASTAPSVHNLQRPRNANLNVVPSHRGRYCHVGADAFRGADSRSWSPWQGVPHPFAPRSGNSRRRRCGNRIANAPCCRAKKAGIRTLGLVGAINCARLLSVSDLQRFNVETHIATDDGSVGHRGFVTGTLGDILERPQTHSLRNPTIYACGPRQHVARSYGDDTFASYSDTTRHGESNGVRTGCLPRLCVQSSYHLRRG